jgi:hypothetical protein
MTFPVLSAGTSAYNLQRSLRFRSSATAYLNRTFTNTGNRQIWTWSGWVKRGALSSGALFGADGSNYAFIYFSLDSLDCGEVVTSQQWRRLTTQVFRDPSAWYHIVFAFDSTQATAGNRIKLYVNGTQVTAFSTSVDPSLNYNSVVNTTIAHSIGSFAAPTRQAYLDGYMTEINFIDGQALTPSSFGSTNAVTGVWQPAKYTGTYGTNGFYLPFTNLTSTSTLGNDFSGNSNNWTTNNISLTPGATYDAMTDVPTLTSPTAANYAVLNPLSIYVVNPTDGNLAFSGTSAGGIGSMGATSGKYYWETVYTAIGSGDGVIVGVRSAESIATGAAENVGYYGGGTQSGQKIINGGAGTAYGATWTTGDVIGVALDITGGSITFYKNNVSQGAISYTFTGKSWVSFNWRTGSAGTNTGSINFGQRPFAYTPPSGFVALNTFNLPSSTIPAGNKYMDATTYTGTGATLSVTNSGSMQPDWVWIKNRSGANSHQLTDSVRGVTKYLFSDATLAEETRTTQVTAITSTGFSLGSAAAVNTSGNSFVGWQWKAGGTAVSNTAGSITSTVSANTTSGFSVVTWTGSGSGAATVGHGLGVAPSMVIVKDRAQVVNWNVYHISIGNTAGVKLNLTDALFTNSGWWNNTSPTSSVFTNGTFTNAASNYVAYCFTPIAGFSAFGSYTGNGSTDGPFIYTGFRPKFVLIKNTDTAGRGWEIIDSSRNTFNVANSILQPDAASAESSSSSYQLDFVSNGFKIRGIDTWLNASGGTYIYAAFAENPFKNALAR